MKWWTLLIVIACCAGILIACDSGDDDSEEEYASFVFINNTGAPDGDGDKPITISRDGGPDWEGSDSFTLSDYGDAQTVTLVGGPGRISYSWASPGTDIDIDEVDNQIIFTD